MSDFLKISRTEYNVLSANSRRAMARQNLHLLLHQSEQELKREREKTRQLELAFYRSEARLANVIGQQLSNFHNSEPTRQAKYNGETSRQSEAATYQDQLDLEEDGCAKYESLSQHFQRSQPFFESRIKQPEAAGYLQRYTFQGLIDKDPLSPRSEDASVSVCSSSSDIADGKQVADSALGSATVKSISVQTEMAAQTQGNLGVPGGISSSLFEKVVNENLRLRDLLEDVLHNKGVTVQSYLVSIKLCKAVD